MSKSKGNADCSSDAQLAKCAGDHGNAGNWWEKGSKTKAAKPFSLSVDLSSDISAQFYSSQSPLPIKKKQLGKKKKGHSEVLDFPQTNAQPLKQVRNKQPRKAKKNKKQVKRSKKDEEKPTSALDIETLLFCKPQSTADEIVAVKDTSQKRPFSERKTKKQKTGDAQITTASTEKDTLKIAPPKSKTVMCQFFAVGKCRKGENCPFLHDEKQKVKFSDIICKYFMEGNCLKGDECMYSHDRSILLCRYFKLGNCTNVNCPYSHDLSKFTSELSASNSITAAGEKGLKHNAEDTDAKVMNNIPAPILTGPAQNGKVTVFSTSSSFFQTPLYNPQKLPPIPDPVLISKQDNNSSPSARPSSFLQPSSSSSTPLPPPQQAVTPSTALFHEHSATFNHLHSLPHSTFQHAPSPIPSNYPPPFYSGNKKQYEQKAVEEEKSMFDLNEEFDPF
eukprot:GCRY01005640.1.p1 GENE.GCRY01005640.1~~GCRY01005640.1.p1  ORF type:complete len:447 (-),score=57.51 GCRY01005640.1:231-1571(-)